jgi:hypothetical protein
MNGQLRRLTQFRLRTLIVMTLCAGTLLGLNLTYIESPVVRELNCSNVQSDGGKIISAKGLGWPFIYKGRLEIEVVDPAMLDDWLPDGAQLGSDGSRYSRFNNGFIQMKGNRVVIEAASVRRPGYVWRIVSNGLVGVAICIAIMLGLEFFLRRRRLRAAII